MYYSLFVSAYVLKSVIDKVANCLLEWTLRLQNKGILGDRMCFSLKESGIAKNLPQALTITIEMLSVEM